MSLLVLLLVLAAVVLLLATLASTVRHDGYGTLAPPRSHLDDAFTGWPGRLV